MNKIYAKTRPQYNKNGSSYYSKIFTAYKTFYGLKLWHLNCMTFTVYQPCCYKMDGTEKGYIEKNYYFALFHKEKEDGSIEWVISLYDLDDRRQGSLKCGYIENGNEVDVYVTGGREGVPVYLTVHNVPLISRFKFHSCSPWQDMTNTTLKAATLTTKNYTLTPNFINIEAWQLDDDYFNDFYITQEEVHINAHIVYNSKVGWGNGSPIMNLPFYESFENKGEVKFSSTFEYTPINKPTVTGVCKIKFNGSIYIGGTGLPIPATGLSPGEELRIHINTSYRRMK